MFVSYEGRSILCVTDTRPMGPCLEIPDGLDPLDVIANYEVRDGSFQKKLDFSDPSVLKVAMVTSYGINCGLATYAKYLCDEMRPLVKDLRIFAEEAEEAEPGVIRSWRRDGTGYDELFKQIKEFEPDVVYIQHEYGCFAHGAKWNTLVGHLASLYRTVVVLHSVYEHPDKLIFEAPCPEIIVHSASGRDLLKTRGINHCSIHHIPHGCFTSKTMETKFSKMESKEVIFQYGFGFEYKGWDQVIDIVDRLRVSHPEVTYIGVFNISQFSKEFGNGYHSRLMKRIRDRGLEKHIVLHKGFRSDEVLLSYMKQSSINLFPYWNHPEWRVHGASGAIRLALASGTPTVVGDVPFFNELKGHVPVCDTIEDYVAELSKLLSDKAHRAEVLESTQKFINERSWDKIAQHYLKCLTQKDYTAI